ncbi:MAG: cupin domain-containing protein [Halobacteriales archaeon]|nr:cupin domain-containing protein [Halobacteriales archaeon]
MEKISADGVESGGMGPADRRGLTDALGASDLAINHYSVEPGEGFSGGLHTHIDQEELFYVTEGEVTFTVGYEGDESVVVEADEAIRFAPGEYQTSENTGDGEATAIALGAPRDSEDVRLPQPCPEGDSDNMQMQFGDDGMVLVCPECGTELDA